jgi:hypothetical protein
MSIADRLRELASAARAGWEGPTAAPSKPETGRDSLARLRRAAAANPELTPLVHEVEAGRMKVTDAAVQAGLRKPKSRLNNLRSAWKLASEEERREFLREAVPELERSYERVVEAGGPLT